MTLISLKDPHPMHTNTLGVTSHWSRLPPCLANISSISFKFLELKKLFLLIHLLKQTVPLSSLSTPNNNNNDNNKPPSPPPSPTSGRALEYSAIKRDDEPIKTDFENGGAYDIRDSLSLPGSPSDEEDEFAVASQTKYQKAGRQVCLVWILLTVSIPSSLPAIKQHHIVCVI